jgi:hypothetical protein
MIDYYYNIPELNTKDCIQECINYYQNKGYDDYYDYYDDYDDINELKPKTDYKDKSTLFKRGEMIEITTNFMKWCHLEAIKRCIEMQADKDSKGKNSDLNKEINDYKGDFQYYPDTFEEDISDKLLAKEELRRHIIPSEVGTISDKCDSKFFELAPHQLFLKNLLSPNTQYRGILIFHGVGVGKSCSGISIAENFKDVYGDLENRIIILASQNIQIGWRKTIFDPRKGDNQCTGDEYYYDTNSEDKKTFNDKTAKKKIKRYYELHGYAAFANRVKKLILQKTNSIQDSQGKYLKMIETIESTFSNRVLIIDEVHNIRTEEGDIKSRDTIKYIELVIKHSKNLRLILLTANPMYNISSEIVWILNMLLLNDNRTLISEKDMFDADGNMNNIEYLKDKCKGYISYLRGENPVSFPIRLYPNHDKERLMKSPGMPTDIFGNEIPDKKRLSFLELFCSPLMNHQKSIYMSEMIKYRGLLNLRIEDEGLLLQLSNIVYPGDSDDPKDLYGDEGLMNCMNKKIKPSITEYSYKNTTIEKYGEFFKKDLIGNYSSKIASLLDIIEKSDGIVFIYSNWIKSGVIPLVLALEQNGYGKYDGKKVLKSKSEPISYEGKYLSEYSDKKDFKPAKYMVIAGSGENLVGKLEEELRVVASSENSDGSQIKVVIGSTVASEGLDFKNIRTIHILEPWHNINKIEQVIGRGIRNCSHKELDEKERNVTVYLHSSQIDANESIDMYLYRYSEYKAKQIGKIENILKTVAIDKYFFKNSNILTEKDIGKFKVQPAYRYKDGPKSFMYKGGDKKYSRVCSFTPVCDYMKGDKPKIYQQNEDTFQIKYSDALIQVYKKRIHNMFLKSVSYTLEELMEALSEYKEVYNDILFHALREMEVEKYTLHNCFGDKGYLSVNDGFYNFQPWFNSDKLLSSYYRLNSGNIKSEARLCIIESKEKRISEIIVDRQSFIEEEIRRVYDNFTKQDKFQDFENDIIKNSRVTEDIVFQYLFDRLSYNDKLILCYSVCCYVKDGESYEKYDFMERLVKCVEKLFIYYDESFKYYRKFEEKNRDELIGFFLYHNLNRKPVFYRYDNDSIEVFNRMDELDISKMIKDSKKTITNKGNWGFTTYAERHRFKNNGIVLKVIKRGDKLRSKYAYPPGPGVVIQDQGGVGTWVGESTLKFIKEELKHHWSQYKDQKNLEAKKNEKNKKDKNKKKYVFFIELCLRLDDSCIQNDLIFMKYY